MIEEKLFDQGEIEQYYRGFSVAGERKEGLAENITPVFFDSVPYCGKRTSTFAYLAVPEQKAAKRYPAIVLVHGGNGKAEHEWAFEWAKHGYVAIAIDINAQMYTSAGGDFTENPSGGPKGYGSFDQMNGDLKDTWAYHSTANAILAKKLLESLDYVDAEKIGIAGISWGGFITYLTAANCRGFSFCSVSYTSAFLYKDRKWREEGLTPDRMGEKNYNTWVENLDPSRYIPQIHIPTLLIRGADDICFDCGLWNRTAELFAISPVLSLHSTMIHDQERGANQREIFAFADGITGRGSPLPSRICTLQVLKHQISGVLSEPENILEVWAVFTESAAESSYDWKWNELRLKRNGSEFCGLLSGDVRHVYILVKDKNSNLLSSRLYDLCDQTDQEKMS